MKLILVVVKGNRQETAEAFKQRKIDFAFKNQRNDKLWTNETHCIVELKHLREILDWYHEENDDQPRISTGGLLFFNTFGED